MGWFFKVRKGVVFIMFLMFKKKFVRSTLLILLISFFNLGAIAKPSPKYASLVIDAKSGIVIHQKNAAKQRHPASLVKMMTLYMTFHALEKGRIKLSTPLTVSKKAASQPPSKIGVKAGDKITVRNAILALSVKSANDVAVVLAENLASSEAKFAKVMNRMAKKLGMTSTHFKNASGLHDKGQVTNAYDMARLAIALRRDYKRYYSFFDVTKFSYKNKVFNSHNKVAMYYKGADGLKTGYINASGFNLVTSVKRSGESIVGVVMGGETAHKRDKHMVDLLDSSLYILSGNLEFKKENDFAAFEPNMYLEGDEDSVITKTSLSEYQSPNLKPSNEFAEKSNKNSEIIIVSDSNNLLPHPVIKPNFQSNYNKIVILKNVKKQGSVSVSQAYSPAPSLKPNA